MQVHGAPQHNAWQTQHLGAKKMAMQRLLDSSFGSYRKKSCRLSRDVFVADHHMVSSQGRYMSSHGVIARKIYLYVNVLYYLLCVNFLYVRCAGVNLAKQMLLA